MQTLAQIRSILDASGLRPQKFLGQNFLLDHNLIRKLVDASGVGPGDVALEVGPGTGTLTEELLERGARVVACELDRGLAAVLRERFAGQARFALVEGDCLDGKRAINPALDAAVGAAMAESGATGFRLVANLPYGAATPLMSLLLTTRPRCLGMWVTIQREVADRMSAGPGTKEYGPVGIVAQALARVELIATLPPECFWPRPDITSAMIGVSRLSNPLTDDGAALLAFASAVFAQRRKQLGSVLSRAGGGAHAALPPGITPTARAEELSVVQIIELLRLNPHLAPGRRT